MFVLAVVAQRYIYIVCIPGDDLRASRQQETSREAEAGSQDGIPAMLPGLPATSGYRFLAKAGPVIAGLWTYVPMFSALGWLSCEVHRMTGRQR